MEAHQPEGKSISKINGTGEGVSLRGSRSSQGGEEHRGIGREVAQSTQRGTRSPSQEPKGVVVGGGGGEAWRRPSTRMLEKDLRHVSVNPL